MFQTFSGSSRRPRQVNLSGQNVNPFAATSWSPTASGTKKTVAVAQQERLQRQQDRERLNATKRIQRSWRGHKSRRDLANSRRQMWDGMERNHSGEQTSTNLAGELRLLVAFFNDKNSEDNIRLDKLSRRILDARSANVLSEDDFRPHLSRLVPILLASLGHTREPFPWDLLRLLVLVVDSEPSVILKYANEYYRVITSISCSPVAANDSDKLLLTAIRCPLVEHSGMRDSSSVLVEAYTAFALIFLTTSNLPERLGGMMELSRTVNINCLSQALLRQKSTSALLDLLPDSRLWLLAYFICLHRLQQGVREEPNFLRALSVLLSSSANDIVGRIDSAAAPESADDDDSSVSHVPLPEFVKDELVSLVNKESVTGLLTKFNIEYNETASAGTEGDASLLASYALILLRIFPTLGEEIRMWLYQGSIYVGSTGRQIPAVKLFWKAMSETKTFIAIRNDPTSALTILRAGTRRQNSTRTRQEETMDRDWRAILLFLELYAFVLRFTDDEEFLSGGATSIIVSDEPLSRSRESALPLEDVKLLTNFLKNLSFTMYYNAGELTGDERTSNFGGLGAYFGTTQAKQSSVDRSHPGEQASNPPTETSHFLGIAGMTYDYVRDIVTRVTRMLYERDSRRRFLPRDHWLMTSRFDMEGFIPAVVAEEERRSQVAEEGDEQEVDSYDAFGDSSNDIIGMHRPRRLRYLENMQRQQQKMARKNLLAAVGPRLEILQNMPFVIPFKTRVQIFRQFVYQDQLKRRDGQVDPDMWRMSQMHTHGGHSSPMTREILGRHHAKIRRDHIFEDAYEQFYQLGEGLKEPIQITFVDKFDTVEAGIDGGGVTKEFLTSVTNEAFRSENGANLFVANDQNLLYPNPAALDERRELLRQSGIKESDPEWRETMTDLLRQYEFLGRVVGKCLYEGILVDIGFAGFFLLKWASADSTGSTSQDSRYLTNINDLRDLDESLYQGLLKLKNYPGSVEDFALDFTVADTISLSGEPTRTITRELLPNGSDIPVTNENRVLYVSGVARHRLHGQPFQQTRAFLRGLGQMINPSWLSMFNQAELQTLIGGDSSQIDVDDLRNNTIYSGVYVVGDDGVEHPTVQLFWQVLKELDDSDRRKVLKYVTSTPRAPLLGFSQLNPRFSIRDAGADEQRLPSTSTCINLLKLPRYSTKNTLASKLLYAVNSGAGFDLS